MNSLTRLNLRGFILESIIELTEEDEASSDVHPRDGEIANATLDLDSLVTNNTNGNFNSANFEPVVFGEDGSLGPYLYSLFHTPGRDPNDFTDVWWTTGANAKGTNALSRARWTKNVDIVNDNSGRKWYSLSKLSGPTDKLDSNYNSQVLKSSKSSKAMYDATGILFVSSMEWLEAGGANLEKLPEADKYEGRQTWSPPGSDEIYVSFPSGTNFALTKPEDDHRNKAVRAQVKRKKEEKASGPGLSTRVARIVKMMDLDVYGPILSLLSDAEQGLFGPGPAEGASKLFKRTETLSMLSKPWVEEPTYTIKTEHPPQPFERTGSKEPLVQLYKSIVRPSLKTGLDGDQFALAYTLLANASGLDSPLSTLDELYRLLTGADMESFKRDLAQLKLMLNNALGNTSGVVIKKPNAYIKQESNRLIKAGNSILPDKARIRSAKDVEPYVEKAEQLAAAIEASVSVYKTNLSIFRGMLQNDKDVIEVLSRSGLLPKDSETLGAFSGYSV